MYYERSCFSDTMFHKSLRSILSRIKHAETKLLEDLFILIFRERIIDKTHFTINGIDEAHINV